MVCFLFDFGFVFCSGKRSVQKLVVAKKLRVFIGQLLLQAQQLVALNRPPERDQYSVRYYIEKNGCFIQPENRFVYEKEDLVTLRPGRDHSFVDAFVERMLRYFDCRPLKASNFQQSLTSEVVEWS